MEPTTNAARSFWLSDCNRRLATTALRKLRAAAVSSHRSRITRWRVATTRSIWMGHILDRRLSAHRLRIELHQAQYIFRHTAAYAQTELACPRISNGIIVRPGATAQQPG